MDNFEKFLNSKVDKNDVTRLLNSLSAEQTAKLNAILRDKQATEQILSSPKAQQLLNALLNEGKQNG